MHSDMSGIDQTFFGPADKMDGDTTPKLHWGKMHSDMSCIDQTSSDTTGVQYDSMTVAAHEKMYPLAQVLQALLLKLPW